MPVFEIDQETLDNLPDEVKPNLKAYEPEDTEGLKNKANQLLSEKKKADAKAAELEAQLAATVAKQKSSKVDNADEGKLTDALSRLEAAQERAEKLEKQIQDGKLEAEAKRIGAELAPTDARRAGMLAKEAKARLQLDGDSITVLSKDGNASISSLSDLAGELKQDFDFLVDGTKASGGSATGGRGRADTSTTIKHSDYKALSAHERGALRKKGITIVDD